MSLHSHTFSARYSLKRFSDGWAVIERLKTIIERGLTYDEAHSVAAYWDSVDEAEAAVTDDAEPHSESASDRQYQSMREAI